MVALDIGFALTLFSNKIATTKNMLKLKPYLHLHYVFFLHTVIYSRLLSLLK